VSVPESPVPARRRLWPAPDSTAWYFAPTVVGAALPIVTLPLITHALAPAEYGAWVLAVVYATFLSGLGNFGLTVAYERNFFEFQDPQAAAALLWSTLAFVSTLLAALVASSWWLREPLSRWVISESGHAALFAWTTTAVCVQSLRMYFLLYLRNRREARSYALFSVDETILGAVLSVAFVVWWGTGPVGLAWGPLTASVIVLIALLVRFVRRVPPRFAKAPLVASLRLSLPLLPRLLVSVVGTQFDKWIIGIFGSTAAAAVYAIGQRLANTVFLFATALENSFQPRTYRLMFERGAEGGAEVGRLLTPYAAATVGLAMLVTLFADEAVALLTPRGYAAAALVTNILAVHFALMFFGKQPQLTFAKRTDLVSWISLFSVAITGVGTAALAYAFGAVGAASGMLVSGAIVTAVFVVAGQRYYRIGYETGKLCALYGALVLTSALVIFLRVAVIPIGMVYAIKGVVLVAAAIALWRPLRRLGW
jgi:O-antigen/teichoic acid export membrane protein